MQLQRHRLYDQAILGIFQCALRCFFAFVIVFFSAATCVRADIAEFDVLNGDHPQLYSERGAEYLVVNLNPLLGDSVTIQSATTSTAPRAPATGGGSNQKPIAAEQIAYSNCQAHIADATPPQSTIDACETYFNDVNAEMTKIIGDMSHYSSADDLKNEAVAMLNGLLEDWSGNTKYVQNNMIIGAQSPAEAISKYRAWLNEKVFHQGNWDTDKNLYQELSSTNIDGITRQFDSLVAIIPPGTMTQLTRLPAARSTRAAVTASPNFTAITTQANTLYGELTAMETNPNQLYQRVDAECLDQGFSQTTYAIMYRSAANPQNQWQATVKCFPEFQVGAIFYANFLNTDSYTLVAPAGGTAPATPVITKQQNNVNQGSAGLVFQACPGKQGATAICFLASMGSGANGLNGLIGGGVLLFHRIIGIHGGLAVGQINVLTNGYQVGQSVPSGAVFTRSALSTGGFIGLSLNIPGF